MMIILLYLICLFQIISSSSSKFNNQVLVNIKSIDHYLCQNYALTCFFRQRHHQSFVQQQENICKSYLILRSCLHNDNDLIRMCPQIILNQVKLSVANQMPTHCLSSSVYKNIQLQHPHSFALRKTSVDCSIPLLFFIIHYFFISDMNKCD